LSRNISQALAAWLAAGETRMGELAIQGRYELRHHLDCAAEGLAVHSAPEAAYEIALYDKAGNYRPLKTAPTLRRGWRLVLETIEQLHEALDFFYPAMLAARLAFEQGRLGVTPLRETLNRQSGMYAITKKISDSHADRLIGAFCRSDGGCLKTIMWAIAPGVPVTSLPAEKFKPGANGASIPLLCAEPCNLFVAAAREAVKKEGP
jgi:sirohydrochlorin cobaltochelatase